MKGKENTMKRPIKAKSKARTARNLFVELSEGMKALTDERLGERTLRTHTPSKAGNAPKRDR